MKTARRRILLALIATASAAGGCGRDRQVIVKERRGAPTRVHAGDGVRVRAPFVDVRVPARKATPVDEPAFDPE